MNLFAESQRESERKREKERERERKREKERIRESKREKEREREKMSKAEWKKWTEKGVRERVTSCLALVVKGLT